MVKLTGCIVLTLHELMVAVLPDQSAVDLSSSGCIGIFQLQSGRDGCCTTRPSYGTGLQSQQGCPCCARSPIQQPPQETRTGVSCTCKLAIPCSMGTPVCHETRICTCWSQRLAICGVDLPGSCDRPNGLSCHWDTVACQDPILPPDSIPSPNSATCHADFPLTWDGACKRPF